MPRSPSIAVVVFVLAGLGLIAYAVSNDSSEGATSPESTNPPVEYQIERDPDVPPLPFDDNPDPSQCGIPTRWGANGRAFLTGLWEGELIQPEVLVYDSHLRLSVAGSAPHGTEVEILFYQTNPVLNYYLVSLPGGEQGWVPEPFLSFDPVI